MVNGCRLPAPTPDSSAAAADPTRHMASVQTIGPYHITCRPAHEDLLVEIRCRGWLLESIRNEQLLNIGFRTIRNATDPQCVLADLNGDQQPELVLCTAPPGPRWERTLVCTPSAKAGRHHCRSRGEGLSSSAGYESLLAGIGGGPQELKRKAVRTPKHAQRTDGRENHEWTPMATYSLAENQLGNSG